MKAKFLKLLIFAAGAYVVADWALSRRKSAPRSAEPPPQYPTDPFYCYENPDDPLCKDFVGI